MNVQSSKTLGNRKCISGFLRLFIFTVLTAALPLTLLNAQTVAYVANVDDSGPQSGNTVSVIDTSTNTLIANIPVGANCDISRGCPFEQNQRS
ncbi:MAG: hypothetical protein LAO76_24815 [Acidobacteriia bacterium]|nr:hypothetical protein [Terriglobia bacterium]